MDEKKWVGPRYERNVSALSGAEVKALHDKKVCVVGAGGLGGYIVELLSRIGVHHLTVVDYDVFDRSNLNRQLHSSETVLGKSKAEVTKERIGAVNSNVRIEAVKAKFSEDNAIDIIQGHDLVIDALDNIQTRKILAKACSDLGLPMVHGSIGGWYGQVACVFPGDGLIDKLFKHVDRDRGVEAVLGNLPFTASAIASMQSAEAVKVLLGRPVERGTVLQVDLLNGDFQRIELK